MNLLFQLFLDFCFSTETTFMGEKDARAAEKHGQD
jgi:hypothetical protein